MTTPDVILLILGIMIGWGLKWLHVGYHYQQALKASTRATRKAAKRQEKKFDYEYGVLKPELVKMMIADFSDRTFGKDRPFSAPLWHMKKEIDECLETPTLEEYSDLQLLLLDSFRKAHEDKSVDELFDASMDKISVLKKREWGEPDENGVIEHKKDD